MAPNESASAVFLDRDGTLMREVNYCSDPKLVEIFPGVPEALVQLKAAGYKLIVISNQAGIGRGYFTEAQYRLVEAEVARAVLPATFDGVYFCPDRPDRATDRRKPAPGMVLEAERDHGIDLARSFFIGDKAIDVECGRNAGVRTILVKTGYGAKEAEQAGADWVADDFRAAAEIIRGLGKQPDAG
ncbi:MAG: HAD family hydrolase [Verrucomicrobiota bacterium]|nr:HAD family hydrolase [Verrucomicrobiota bacterium]